MAGRNIKESADWFKHDADASSDEKIVYLETMFGFKGYAFYFKMLEILTRSNNFEIEYNDIKKAILSKKIGISVSDFDQIISESCREEIGAFKIQNKILYSPGLKKRMNSLLEKREQMREKYHKEKESNKEKEIKKDKSRVEYKEIDQKVSEIGYSESEIMFSESEIKYYRYFKEKYWPSYPFRNGRQLGKNEAYQALKKYVKLSELSENYKALIKYSKSKEAKNGYTKDPKRFFKNSNWRWQDWLEKDNKEKTLDKIPDITGDFTDGLS